MAWVVLILSGLLETVWALALEASRGFTRPLPSLVFLAAMALSMGGLALALRSIPVGTAYAVWVGIGAVGTAAAGMVWLGEPVSVGRIVCLLLIIGGVVGLNLLS
ncbi:DMT family transporter [Thermostaphylospora chromogena]|jgi:quaternary ammonium compound-resistance protein SugE|uniref:Quaternary ammonium compound-resistance protein SugE n=1 Tax=Thermostaphylospora chromogena TaxID=35622 RepID=A0A1H1H7L2_9ACTN|nr:multidrug efflux SMR transporter [Thermostaphylospora chromogena]SDR21485.1 quaternary ammonium compound-resistance protein SugE [Thermostaphylospora chromogena]